ncbi:MAG: HAD family hydrolase [candidate division KSB1 bacterium]|nr:HAD family hydrolase [candidate division KSB1 bacterium]
MKLLLFDIDGTLIDSGGAGKRAMNRAFEELYGHAEILANISLSGRTDELILQDAFQKIEQTPNPAAMSEYKKLYFQILRHEIEKPNAKKRVMPGITDLLPELKHRQDIYLGLLTGNWQDSGYIKIGHFSLDSYFSFGAFSDDSNDRSELVPIAVSRFENRTEKTIAAEHVYIIGDTPRDIECTKPHGVNSVAVAAAGYTRNDLQAYNPDFLFDDLSSTVDVLEILG